MNFDEPPTFPLKGANIGFLRDLKTTLKRFPPLTPALCPVWSAGLTMSCDAKATASYFWHLDSAGAIRVLRQKLSCVWIRKCSPLIACRETQKTLLGCRKKASSCLKSSPVWWNNRFIKRLLTVSLNMTAKKHIYFCLSFSSSQKLFIEKMLHSTEQLKRIWWSLLSPAACSPADRCPLTATYGSEHKGT